MKYNKDVATDYSQAVYKDAQNENSKYKLKLTAYGRIADIVNGETGWIQ